MLKIFINTLNIEKLFFVFNIKKQFYSRDCNENQNDLKVVFAINLPNMQ